ncbi:Protocadherin [Brachionus plicatilis]|uniref:Protocadherin n=1 Tax=Brachionus plicatilis TaxID=10195 RepID=A0A3M7T105_BRAPC|nr:Protocadherin [Brachionus plicatilis]
MLAKTSDLNQTIPVYENTKIGSLVCSILLKSKNDSVLYLNGALSHKFKLFRVESGSSYFMDSDEKPKVVINYFWLMLAQRIDREVESSIDLTLSTNVSEQISHLNIAVMDINDNAPKFSNSELSFHLVENNQENISIGKVRATDPDCGENGTINYFYDSGSFMDENNTTLSDEMFHSVFAIEPKSGTIHLKTSLDREQNKKFTFKIMARDNGRPSLESTEPIGVNIIIDDLNDNAPQFYQQESNFYIRENSEPNSFIGWFKAFDPDSGLNSQLDYFIEKVEDFDPPVYINEHGVLKSLHHLQISNHSGFSNGIFSLPKYFFDLKIVVKDRGIDKKLSQEKLIRIIVYESEIVDRESEELYLDGDEYNLEFDNETGLFDFFPTDSLGLNCEQVNLIDYFQMHKNGSLKVVKKFDNETVCFVNVRKISQSKTYVFEVVLYKGVDRKDVEKFRQQKMSTKRLLKPEHEEKSTFVFFYFLAIGSLMLALFGFVFALVYSSKLKLVKKFLSEKMQPISSLINYRHEEESDSIKNSKLTQSMDSGKQLIDLKKEIDLCNKKLKDFNWNGCASSTNSSLLIKDSPGGSSVSEEAQPKKVSYGIYQVANQIIIDYDDNTSCEVVSSKNTLNSSLKRFENIYYSENGGSVAQADADKSQKCLSSFVFGNIFIFMSGRI